jgi:hypothetical protein
MKTEDVFGDAPRERNSRHGEATTTRPVRQPPGVASAVWAAAGLVYTATGGRAG